MRLSIGTYISGNSPVHSCDARVKVLLLLAYWATLFLVDTWLGLLVCAVVYGVIHLLSGVPFSRVIKLAIPVYVIVGIMIVCNSFLWTASGFAFNEAGYYRACFFALRIILLVFATFLVSFSTTSNELTDAFRSFLKPLRVLRVPVDDMAMVFSLALRFIPVTAEEFSRVYNAQVARGAAFDDSSLRKKVRAWQTVFIPLIAGLFRRSEVLALAMEARCYNAETVPAKLHKQTFGAREFVQCAGGFAVCVALSVFL